MSGLFRRLSPSRRSAGPEGSGPPEAAQPESTDAPAPIPAEAAGQPSLLADPAADARRPEPPPGGPVYGPPIAAVGDLPAGLDPDELAAVPDTSARRSRLRRRVAFLRAAREVLLRDLGGFVYELHRTAGDIEHDAHRRLRETKLSRLSRVDAELHELELRLDDVRRQVIVREPGVGGECPNCGELFGSDAHFCAHCGLPLTESGRRRSARTDEPPADSPPPPADAPLGGTTPPEQHTQELSRAELDEAARSEFRWPVRDGDPPPSRPDAPRAAEPKPPAAGGQGQLPATDETIFVERRS